MNTKLLKKDGKYYTGVIAVPTKTKEGKDGEKKVLESIDIKVKVGFDTLRKAMSELAKTDGAGNVKADIVGAGEQILMFGTVESEELNTVLDDPYLKLSACMALSEIVGDFPISELKKN